MQNSVRVLYISLKRSLAITVIIKNDIKPSKFLSTPLWAVIKLIAFFNIRNWETINKNKRYKRKINIQEFYKQDKNKKRKINLCTPFDNSSVNLDIYKMCIGINQKIYEEQGPANFPAGTEVHYFYLVWSQTYRL